MAEIKRKEIKRYLVPVISKFGIDELALEKLRTANIIRSFGQNSLSAYYVSGTVLGSRSLSMNKKDQISAPIMFLKKVRAILREVIE